MPDPLHATQPDALHVRTSGDEAIHGVELPSERASLAERSVELIRQARIARPAARRALENQVVTEHMWLADTLARRYDHRGEDLDDLIQVARAGLIEAVRRFDPDQGAFAAFAVPTISGVLKRHFRDRGWLIRPPRRTQELAALVRGQWPELAQELGTTPSVRDLAVRLGQPAAEVRDATHASQWYTANSLDAALASGVRFPADHAEDALGPTETRLVISRACGALTADELRLLRMRFYEDRSQSDIAVRIGTSQMQVSRLLARTLHRLRNVIGSLEASTPGASGQESTLALRTG